MDHFPVFLRLEQQPVLVVGGGDVAERKVSLLLRAGARVRVVARELNPALLRWQDEGALDWHATRYRPDQLDGMLLAYAATDDVRLNRRVFADAEARCVPVNAVDDQAHCRFITPAIVDRSPLQVAISSGGASPVLARRLRTWLEQSLPAGLGSVARVAGQLRSRIAHWPLTRRRRAWDRVLGAGHLRQWASLSDAQLSSALGKALLADPSADTQGSVTLVGAGPGDPELLTLKALQALGEADVILHDRLVPDAILDMARRDAQRIDVGKRAGQKHRTQAHIHELMVAHARRGRHVVRLKGGDPFVYGRGGEEIEALAAAGIPFEVVPGITAATGCAASARIPLTHRDHAQVLSLVTGQSANTGNGPDWAALAGPGRTVVVYMGLKQAARLQRQLLDAGVPASLPVALLADGTRKGEQVLHGTVADLPLMADRVGRGAPTLMVLGEVAAVGAGLSEMSNASLRRVAA